jgi:hypothetical protein
MSEEGEAEEGKDVEKKGDFEIKLSLDLQKLSQLYNIPFTKVMEIIDEDRKIAKENYQMLKDKFAGGDDSATTKEQLNEAMRLVIDSTDKLVSLMSSASKLCGDAIRAMAIQNMPRSDSPKEIEKRRQRVLDDEKKD